MFPGRKGHFVGSFCFTNIRLCIGVYIICNMRFLDFDFYIDSAMDPLAAMNTHIRMKTAKLFNR